MYLLQKNIFLFEKVFSPYTRTLILLQCFCLFVCLSQHPVIWRSFAVLSLLPSILPPILPTLGTCSAVWNKFLFWPMLACLWYCLQLGPMLRQLTIRVKVWWLSWGRYFVGTAEIVPALYIWLLYIYWKSYNCFFLSWKKKVGCACSFVWLGSLA